MKAMTLAITPNQLVFAVIRGMKGIDFNVQSLYWNIFEMMGA